MCYLDFGRFINTEVNKCIINVVISPTFLATSISEALQFIVQKQIGIIQFLSRIYPLYI